MYCPKCAAQNLDDAKYCRACGVDISLVPQAVAGELAKRLEANESGSRQPPRAERPTIESGLVSLFMGVAFLLIAYALSRPGGGGDNWWFYMLIPAFGCLAKGISTLIRLNQEKSRTPRATYAHETTQLNQPQRAAALPPSETSELIAPPPSVTEATTRHLGVPVERRPKDV